MGKFENGRESKNRAFLVLLSALCVFVVQKNCVEKNKTVAQKMNEIRRAGETDV